MPDRLQSLAAETFQMPADAVTDDLEFGGAPGWDSLNHVNLMLGLERSFGLPPIADDDMVELTSIAAIRAYLARANVALAPAADA